MATEPTPITYPAEWESGRPAVRVYPGGQRWDTAGFIRGVARDRYMIHLWTVTIESIHPGLVNTYIMGVVWPKNWEKITPAYVAQTLDGQGARVDEAELIRSIDADMKAAFAGELPPGVADADIIIDTREDVADETL